jgi:hypothetical protein
VFVNDHSADVATGEHVFVGQVDVGELVFSGHGFVE